MNKDVRTRRRTVNDRELELREASSRRWDHVIAFPFFVVEKLVSWPVALVFASYFFFVLGAEHFAGVSTSLVVSAMLDIGGDDWIPWTTIGVLVAANATQAYTFRWYIKRKGQREKELEAMLDPGRSSSGLTPSGQPKK